MGKLETANKVQDSSVSFNDFIKFITQSIILWDRQTLPCHTTDVSVLLMLRKVSYKQNPCWKTSLSYSKKKIKIFLAKSFVSRYQKSKGSQTMERIAGKCCF